MSIHRSYFIYIWLIHDYGFMLSLSLSQDQHTIMCAWAVRDHNPKCQLYVQILKPENRLHLEVADHIVCEGELKYALVANSCHCPGITTLVRTCPLLQKISSEVILLIHTWCMYCALQVSCQMERVNRQWLSSA